MASIVSSIVRSIVRPVVSGGGGAPAVEEPAEFITNGGFDTDTDWTKQAGVTISGGAANFPAASRTLSQTLVQPLIMGNSYTLSFTFTGCDNGITNNLGAADALASPYSAQFVSGGAAAGITLENLDDFAGTIDNVSLVPTP